MSSFTHKSSRQPFPYSFYTFPPLILVLLGLIDSCYLAWLHYQNYTNLTFASFCALSNSINCDTVAQSPWSIAFGLPLALWGTIGYLLLLILLLPILRKNPQKFALWYLIFFLTGLYSIVSLYLGYISAIEIHAYCILCMASYAINFALFFYSWIIIRRFSTITYCICLIQTCRSLLRTPPVLFGIICIFFLIVFSKQSIPTYWKFTPPLVSDNLLCGITEDGHPWIGADNPELIINEYTDYQCFQCSKMHLFLRQFVATNPKSIRLVHHHYPMDHAFNSIIVPEPFHVGSGKMAMIGIFAASRNKFWEMNDALYAIGRRKEAFNTRTLAKMTGMHAGELAAATRSEVIRNMLLYDIREGMKLEIIGTPTFVINGQVYPGAIPAEILQPYLH